MESSLKEIRWAEHKYMNIHQPLLNPPPPTPLSPTNYRTSDVSDWNFIQYWDCLPFI